MFPRTKPLLIHILSSLTLLASAAPVQAQNFSVGAGTEFPLGISINAATHFPAAQTFARIRYGRFLPPYVQAMNSLAQGLGFYNSAAGELIYEGMKGASALELGVGWEQNPASGWFADVTYTYLKGSGQVQGSTILAAVGSSLPSGGNVYDLESTVHSIGVRGGYKWIIGDSLSLWGTFGVIKPFDSGTILNRDVSGAIQRALLDAASTAIDSYLNNVYRSNVWIPVLGATLVYRFQI